MKTHLHGFNLRCSDSHLLLLRLLSMKKCIDATNYRRRFQIDYNAKHGKEMKSTQGSSVLTIFELLKDQIEAVTFEDTTSDICNAKGSTHDHITLLLSPLGLHRKGCINIVTDHVPSKPGVYFWKDADGNILYIGKAKRLRSRVKSYLSPMANHSTRIQVMLKKASSVEFVLTPSDHDAVLLENKLIKHHQPLYNILLKDDESYPYICATIGDTFPQLTIAPTRQEGTIYRYFGPYPKYTELHEVLQSIEVEYDLRLMCFQARYGGVGKAEYTLLFEKVIAEVFDKKGCHVKNSLQAQRAKYEASDLFESRFNTSRDVVVVGQCESTHLVYVLQLREGLVASQFSYAFELKSGLHSSTDFGDVIQNVLEKKHYPSGATWPGEFSFFPDEILTQYPVAAKGLREAIRAARNKWEPERVKSVVAIRRSSSKGIRHESDTQVLHCAMENAAQVAKDRSLATIQGVPVTSVDGTAALELADLLSLEDPPRRIECFDISHTHGEGTVASRVVFINGRPVPDLSRRFNIESIQGGDDYASLEEVLERRFRRVWANEGSLVAKNDPWAKPDLVVIDGGKGQLTSALKGMAKANVFPPSDDMKRRRGENSTVSDSLILQTENIDQHTFVPIVSLAKNKEEVFGVKSSLPMNTRQDSAALLLLRAIRDESHRFALKSHQKRRSKANGL